MVFFRKKHSKVLDIYFLCDCSGSMAGENIAALNSAISGTFSELSGRYAHSTELRLQINAISFANDAEWYLQSSQLSAGKSWLPIVNTGGITALGSAYKLLAFHLSKLGDDPHYLPPVILLLSDGKPTDNARAGLDKLLATSAGALAKRFAAGIGAEASAETLYEMAGHEKAHTALATDAIELRNIVERFVLGGVQQSIEQYRAGLSVPVDTPVYSG